MPANDAAMLLTTAPRRAMLRCRERDACEILITGGVETGITHCEILRHLHSWLAWQPSGLFSTRIQVQVYLINDVFTSLAVLQR